MSGMFDPTVASITLQATLGRRRALIFGLPAVILLLVTLALKASHPADTSWPGLILGDFGFSVILPLTALIIGSSVLGAEIDDGSIVLLVAIPEFIAGLIATGGATKLAVGLFVGALAGSVIYNAVFVMISATTTRAIAIGLLYVLIW